MARLDETISTGQAGHISDHQQLAVKANYVYDVQDFGAVGDGSTDDTAAIQAAVDAAALPLANVDAPKRGGIVFLPPGRFLITDSITIGEPPTDTNNTNWQKWVSIVGAGMGVSTIVSDSTNTAAAILVSDPTDNTYYGASGPKFEEFSIEGSGGGTGQHGIHLGQINDNVVIRRVRIGKRANTSLGGHGIYVFDTLDVHIENCVIEECVGSGIRLVAGEYPGPNACNIIGTSCKNNGAHGFHMTATGAVPSYNVRYQDGILESNGGSGFRIDQGLNVIVDGVHLEDNGAANYTAAYYSTFRNLLGGDAFTVDGTNTLFYGCTFSDTYPVTITAGRKSTIFDSCAWEDRFAQSFLDSSDEGAIFTNCHPFTGNQDTTVTTVPPYRDGLDLFLADQALPGMMVRVINGGYQNDRLLYARDNTAQDTEWTDLSVGVLAGAITDTIFGEGQGPAVAPGTLGVDTTNKNFYVKTGAAEWSFVPVITAPPEITGARDDGTALADLLTSLAAMGLITDSSTAS